MSTIERHYAIGGTVIALETDVPRFAADLDALLGDVPVKQAPAYSVIARVAPLGEPDGDLVYEGPVPEDGHCVLHHSADATHLCFPGLQSLTLLPRQRRAEINMASETSSIFATILMMVIESALDAAGEGFVHAAGLRIPGSDAAVLLHAPSGTGKTTTALGLASAGFALLSDDAMVVCPHESGWTAWGLPRHVKVHERTAAMLPFLAPVLTENWDANGEQGVTLRRLGQVVPVEAGVHKPIAAVLHLARAAGPVSTVRPASRVDTLVALAADNVRVGRTGLLPLQKRKLEMLTGLAAAVPVLRLEAGSDLTEIGAVVLHALSELAGGSRSG